MHSYSIKVKQFCATNSVTLLTTLLVISGSLALKQYHSMVDESDLQWILRPLSTLVQMVTGYPFYKDDSGVWVNYELEFLLVKQCSGMNFMIMSFVCYALGLSHNYKLSHNNIVNVVVCTLRIIIISMILAWVTMLLANTLRIAISIHFLNQDIDIFGILINKHQLHRLIGLTSYLPILSIQASIISKKGLLSSAYFVAALYIVMVIMIPLLRNSAFINLSLFIENSVTVIASIAGALALLHITLSFKKFRKWCNDIVLSQLAKYNSTYQR